MFIVTEIGMNHMGDAEYADAYVQALVEARPDGVTFQIREPGYYAKQAAGESPYLEPEVYRRAARQLREGGVQFGVGLCDIEQVRFFAEIGTDFYKILSKDIDDRELIAAVLQTGKPVYISTGMSDEDGIESCLKATSDFSSQVSLIHTQLSYNDADTNLRAISRLRERFVVPVAFGSHSTDINVLYAAVGFDPSAMFFYVKGERPIQHKDEDHAITLAETAGVIRNIRRLETMLGDGVKKKMTNRIAVQKI